MPLYGADMAVAVDAVGATIAAIRSLHPRRFVSVDLDEYSTADTVRDHVASLACGWARELYDTYWQPLLPALDARWRARYLDVRFSSSLLHFRRPVAPKL
jgi:hypothetical protein